MARLRTISEPAAAPDVLPPPASSPLWAVGAAAMLTLAVTLASDISLRFLGGGPDLFSLFSAISQAVLALVAGSAFTKVGAGWMARVLGALKAPRADHDGWKTLVAAVVLAVIVGLRLSLPAMAHAYNDHGVRLAQEGKVTRARQALDRATRLNPDYAQAWYNLANVQEETLDLDAAAVAYQKALKLDERLYPAYNNLARLSLLRGNPGGALTLLERGLALEPKEASVRYSFLKNRGWANLSLKYLAQADGDLQAAIAVRPDGAAAQCLLAQVREAQGSPAAAEWQACLANAAGQPDVEATWLGMAQERLMADGA